MQNYNYVGSELELFSDATHWKEYYYRIMRRYLGSDVLEVGAGIGGTTKVICRQQHHRWVCLEPDPELVALFEADAEIPDCCEIRQSVSVELDHSESFDSIVYVDVLEHIEEDRREVAQIISHLNPGGFLIVLGPAHQWLFSEFDQEIGHFRRYNRSSLKQLSPDGLELISIKYLDSIGLLASLSNRFLRQSMPTKSQIKLWDSFMVPLSRRLDPLLNYQAGKSILGVWQKQPPQHSEL